MSRDVLHRTAALLGLFQTAFGIGLLTTTAFLHRIGDRLASVRVIALSVAVSGVAAATYVGTHILAVAFVGVVAWGVDVAFFLPPMQVVLQRATPTTAHGRILALSSTADGVANVIAIPLTGVCVGLIGVRTTGALVGTLAVAAGLAGWVAEKRAGRAPKEDRMSRRRRRLTHGGSPPGPRRSTDLRPTHSHTAETWRVANYANTTVVEHRPVQLREPGFPTPARTLGGTGTTLNGPVAVVIGQWL